MIGKISKLSNLNQQWELADPLPLILISGGVDATVDNPPVIEISDESETENYSPSKLRIR